jgi:oligopeptidase B
MRFLLATALLLAGCATPTPANPKDATMPPPLASKKPRSVTLHGDTRIDDYAWLADKESAEVRAYLESENAYAEGQLRPTVELQETLYQEILGRIQQTDQSAPYRSGEFEYYHRTEEGKQYKTHCRRRPGKPETEEVLLDMNALAAGRPFLSLGAYEVSPDGRYLAFSLDETGFREYTLQIKDLRTGHLLPERIEMVKSVAWASDSTTLFHTVDDDTKRPYRVLRHRLGDAEGLGELVYQEDDERFRVAVWRARSGGMIYRGSFSHTTTEIAFVRADSPQADFRLVAPRRQNVEYYVEHRDEELWIRTNDQGRNFRIVRAPVAKPGPDSWEEIVPHREAVMVEGLDVFESFYVLQEREAGLPQLRVTSFDGARSRRIEMDEPVYALHPGDNEEFVARRYRFRYESLTTPDSVLDYDVDAGTQTLVKQIEVLGGYDPDDYRAERLWVTVADGTRVPTSIVYRKGALDEGPAPMLLVGYGAYGYPYPTTFSHARVSLLDRGFVYAVAHVRGGGELGKHWHDAGRMDQKENSFTDFIAVAERLIAQGYTTTPKLSIEGGSAGGLLMGAVTNMRPDLFGKVVSLVPFVDVLNTMLDDTLPLTVGEYEEWGNPNEREAYFRIKSYCPYSNVRRADYPAMLVRTSLNDSQVMYWEPAKYVAKLRAHKSDDRPLLFVINMDAGHGGSSGRYDYLRETALDYAFILGTRTPSKTQTIPSP